MNLKRGISLAVPTVMLTAVLAGCGDGSTGNGGAGKSSSYQPMTIACDDGSPTFEDNFNPFSVNTRKGVAWIYETLYYINSQDGKETPWLATSYKWDGAKKLTFTIRQGVKWSDGKPFTADDVAFTFNLLKKFPALDSHGLWKSLASVTANGNQVVFTFSQPDSPAFTYINEIPIVPKHLWEKVKDPVKYTNVDPVGTGAFMLEKFTPYQYTLKRNPNYWQADKIHESELKFPALNGAQTADMDLANGKYDWAQAYVPDVEKTYVAKDPADRHYWYAPSDASNIVMNLTEAPFKDVKFRQALEYGINRQELSDKGENGYDKPAHPSGLRIPGQDAYLDKNLEQQYSYSYNPAKAAQILAAAGYKKNSDGKLLGKDGKPIQFSIEVPSGWTDWITDCNLIKDQLAKLGITVNVKTPSVSTWLNDLGTTKFDMSFTTGLNQYDPWFYYDLYLNSDNAYHDGQKASGNYGHWVDAKTDRLLEQYKSVTDPAQKKQHINQLQKIMYQQVPMIPLFYNANWNQYSTKTFVGWPDAKNPYATPSFAIPDMEMIMTHLTLKQGQ
jgi:peptide/nickel transport system substrate-binding protein